MPYLNLDLDLEHHPKMRRLIRAIGDDAMLYLIRLWIYCAKFHTADGRLDGYTPLDIAKAIGWSKEPEFLLTALEKDFLDVTQKGYRIHDWKDHAGHLIAFKLRGKAMAKARWGKYTKSSPVRTTISNPPIEPINPTKPSYPSQAQTRSVSRTKREPDRENNGFTGISQSILSVMPEEIRKEIEADLVIQPETGS